MGMTALAVQADGRLAGDFELAHDAASTLFVRTAAWRFLLPGMDDKSGKSRQHTQAV
jgi:hypothetical protein